MILYKPYKRLYRRVNPKLPDAGFSSWNYIVHQKYADNPQYYVQSYLYLQKELEDILEYVEPDDKCYEAYSFKIHSLLTRVCIEIEANFKAILNENIPPSKSNSWNINTYHKINKTHKLADYKVSFPRWKGKDFKWFKPFESWNQSNSNDKKLDWYDAYNKTKHDRHAEFYKANFKNLMDAITGLLIVISSQFNNYDFSCGSTGLTIGNYYYPETKYGEAAIGDLFRIEYPRWNEYEFYQFNWNNLKNLEDPFLKFDYS